MESSRIFVRGLPPTMTEADFKKHFGVKHPVTDTRLFQQRRIGYVGYQTPEDAAQAVKYFNKTFIRMSKIAVELATPVQDSQGRFSRPIQSQDAGTRQPSAQHVEEPIQGIKRKRGEPDPAPQDPKLQEFLAAMQAPSKVKGIRSQDMDLRPAVTDSDSKPLPDVDEPSDTEYQTIAKKNKTATEARQPASNETTKTVQSYESTTDGTKGQEMVESDVKDKADDQTTIGGAAAASDADWLRSRTSRLLGLADEEYNEHSDREAVGESVDITVPRVEEQDRRNDDVNEERMDVPEQSAENDTSHAENDTEQSIRASQRLYLRNLAYNVTEADLQSQFNSFGDVIEVHVPVDNKTGKKKGFAHIQFANANDAVQAWRELDGRVFQGRLLHILPGAEKRNTVLDDFELSKLPLKQQQRIKRKREASTTVFNWNALYMNADAVMSSVADRLGVNKSELLDPTSSDAAVKQAHAETHVIQETKAYFKDNGVDLDAFKKRERGDTAILVKNFPYDAKASELQTLFEEHGKVKRFLMPPSGTIAIAEFHHAPEARAAFGALAYRKIRGSVLFLEKAPRDLFTAASGDMTTGNTLDALAKGPNVSAPQLLQEDDSLQTAATSTLFVRNLNFTTTSEVLTETFKPLDGFLSGRVKIKTDAKKPGQVLSMGFGFLEFRSSAQAQAALTAMDGYNLEGHKLLIRASHKGTDAAEERRKEDKAKKLAGRRTKLVIKNLPFETTKKDIRSLFGSYGQLRSVRMPKKFDKAARGFAFADFTTPKEAESAMDALRDTHLLGRRLVIDFAAEDPEDAEAEIEKMQKKVGSQINKVALQKLTSGGRKKFNVGDPDADEA